MSDLAAPGAAMSAELLANVTGVAIGGRALLIEGPPGSGKSSLALALIDRGAVLIGDDALALASREGLAWAEPPPNTGGLIEVRNVGIVELPTSTAPIALIIVLEPRAPRFPMEIDRRSIGENAIPVLPFHAGDAEQALRAEYALQIHGLPLPSISFVEDKRCR